MNSLVPATLTHTNTVNGDLQTRCWGCTIGDMRSCPQKNRTINGGSNTLTGPNPVAIKKMGEISPIKQVEEILQLTTPNPEILVNKPECYYFLPN